MIRMAIALVLSFGIVQLVGPTILKKLRELKIKQTIYELGPAHQQKQGTPIMGGFMMVIAVTVSSLVCHPAQWNGGWDFTLALLAVSLLSMLVGLADDWIKAVKHRNLGLNAKQKLLGQVVVAIAFSCYCYFSPVVGSRIIIPFVNVEWDLGIFYIPLMVLLMLFMINSANLQDGLDGLMSTVTCVGSVGWCALAVCMSLAGLDGNTPASQLGSIAVFALTLTGATMGFLRFNYYPAKVFMGDMGSMFLGGAVVGMAMLLRQPVLLLFMSIGPVLSSLSVMLQRGYFKYTKKKYGEGRRIFKMSPLHHHFEKCGLTEPQIIKLYGVVTGILSIVAVCSTGLKLW